MLDSRDSILRDDDWLKVFSNKAIFHENDYMSLYQGIQAPMITNPLVKQNASN